MDPSIKKLEHTVSKLINTTQIITSPTNVVKELTENSLDAGATSVVVKLESFGLDKVEVTDNGSGVSATNAPFMALDNHTSKIRDSSDLERLQTYGFRGQGLAAIASLADLAVSTKPEGAEAGITYVLDDNGGVVRSSPCSMNRGTIVLVTKLFRNFPVRHKMYCATKNKKEELKKMEDLLKSYAIVRPAVRFMLYHDKIPIMQKGPASDTASSLRLVLGSTIANLLERASFRNTDGSVVIEAFLPKIGSPVATMGRLQTDMTHTFVNGRPVKLSMLYKLLKHHYSQTISAPTSQGKYPVCCVSIKLPPSSVDFNVTPDKTLIFLTEKDQVAASLEAILVDYYGSFQLKSRTSHKESILSNIGITSETPDENIGMAAVVTVAKNDFGCSPEESSLASEPTGAAWDTIDAMWEQEISLHSIEPPRTRDTDIRQSVVNVTVQPTRDRMDMNNDDEPFSLKADAGGAEKTKWTLIVHDSDEWRRGSIAGKDGKLIESGRIVTPVSRAKRQMTLDVFNSSTEESPAKRTNSTGGIERCLGDLGVSNGKKSEMNNKSSTTKECQLRNDNDKTKHGAKQNGGMTRQPQTSKRHIPKGEIQFDIKKLREFILRWNNTTLSSGNNSFFTQSRSSHQNASIVGRMSNGFWVISREQRLEIVNHFRLWESIIFGELLETYQLAADSLQPMHLITEREIGYREWHALVELSAKCKREDNVGPKSMVSDNRVTSNGFSIARLEAPEGDGVAFYLTGVAQGDIQLGIPDLSECVGKLSTNCSAKLSECRPTRVVTHLKEMATAFARTKPLPRNEKELQDILSKTLNIDCPTHTCLHGCSLTTEIYNTDSFTAF